MTVPEQAAVLFEAANIGFVRYDDIVRWADSVIVAMDQAPSWVIELSVLNPPNLEDSISILRQHASLPLSLRRRVQIVALAQAARALSLEEALPLLFRAAFHEESGGTRHDALNERLADALVEWDCQADPSVIAHPLRAKFVELMRKYLSDAEDVAVLFRLR